MYLLRDVERVADDARPEHVRHGAAQFVLVPHLRTVNQKSLRVSTAEKKETKLSPVGDRTNFLAATQRKKKRSRVQVHAIDDPRPHSYPFFHQRTGQVFLELTGNIIPFHQLSGGICLSCSSLSGSSFKLTGHILKNLATAVHFCVLVLRCTYYFVLLSSMETFIVASFCDHGLDFRKMSYS